LTKSKKRICLRLLGVSKIIRTGKQAEHPKGLEFGGRRLVGAEKQEDQLWCPCLQKRCHVPLFFASGLGSCDLDKVNGII
jgi:hypothetical protein